MSEKRTITLQSVNSSRASTVIPGTYTKGKERVTLLRNGSVIFGENAKERDDRKLTKGEVLRLNLSTPAAIDFYKEHEGAIYVGEGGVNRNKNFKYPLFVVQDEDEQFKYTLNEKKLKLSAQNMVNNSDLESLYNIAFAAALFGKGKDILKRKPEEVALKVWEWAENNPTQFKELAESGDLEKQIIINKAVALDIIAEKRGVFEYNAISLGTKMEEVSAYFQHNDEQYKLLRKIVVQKDDLPIKYNEGNVDTVTFSAEKPISFEGVPSTPKTKVKK